MNQNQSYDLEIKGVKKLKKIGYYQLEINDEKIDVSDDVIVHFTLIKGRKLSLDEFEEVKKYKELNDYYLKACNYITYQLRSEKEIYEYLEKLWLKDGKKITPIVTNHIDNICSKLKDNGLINDEKLTEYILDSIIRNEKGPKAYGLKLIQRKISKNIKRSIYDKNIEEDVISKVIEKNKDKKSKLPRLKQKEQLYLKLIRDGFSSDLVEAKISRLEFQYHDDGNLEKEINKLLRRYQNSDIKDSLIKNKIIQSLKQKGYEYKEIVTKLNNLDINE